VPINTTVTAIYISLLSSA